MPGGSNHVTLATAVYHDLYADFNYPPRRDWVRDSFWSPFENDEELFEQWNDQSISETSVHSQYGIDDYLLWGPTDTLIRLLATADFCHSVLNTGHYTDLCRSIQQLLQNCGMLWVFEKLVVIIERPESIGTPIRFRDGSIVP